MEGIAPPQPLSQHRSVWVIGCHALHCWSHLRPMARVAKASSRAVRTMGKPGESSERCPYPYPVHCHLAVPPLCKGQISLSPAKSHDRTSKMLKTPMKACEQLQFSSDMCSFVRKTSKPPCAFWPIYSRPVCVKSSLNLFPGQKSLSWVVFVPRRMVKTV